MLRKSPFIAPCMPTLRERSPTGSGWLHELKLDGFRVQIHKDGKRVTLYSKNGHDHSDRYPFLVQALTKIPAKSAVIDGELVAHDASGKPDFYKLLRRKAEPAATCIYAFDLLHINGKDLRDVPLVVRKVRLSTLIRRFKAPCIVVSEGFGNAEQLLSVCNQMGLEGIVSKRMNSLYVSGKTTAWIKVKCKAWREANRERHKLFAKGT